MNKERLTKQLLFLKEIDKMKNILRQNVITDKSRQENDAEHSWHMSVMAIILFEYAHSTEVNMLRVIKMALVHDLVEVFAGDTFCFDEVESLDKEARENIAAEKLFGMLPRDQDEEYRNLWVEFDKMETPDSIYAAAMDRLQPFLLDCYTDGHTWQLGQITSDKLYIRMEQVKYGVPELWNMVNDMIQECIKRGILAK